MYLKMEIGKYLIKIFKILKIIILAWCCVIFVYSFYAQEYVSMFKKKWKDKDSNWSWKANKKLVMDHSNLILAWSMGLVLCATAADHIAANTFERSLGLWKLGLLIIS